MAPIAERWTSRYQCPIGSLDDPVLDSMVLESHFRQPWPAQSAT